MSRREWEWFAIAVGGLLLSAGWLLYLCGAFGQFTPEDERSIRLLGVICPWLLGCMCAGVGLLGLLCEATSGEVTRLKEEIRRLKGEDA